MIRLRVAPPRDPTTRKRRTSVEPSWRSMGRSGRNIEMISAKVDMTSFTRGRRLVTVSISYNYQVMTTERGPNLYPRHRVPRRGAHRDLVPLVSHESRDRRRRNHAVPAEHARVLLEGVDVRRRATGLRGRGNRPADGRGFVHHVRGRLLRGLRDLRRVHAGPAGGRPPTHAHRWRGRDPRARARVHADPERSLGARRRGGAF